MRQIYHFWIGIELEGGWLIFWSRKHYGITVRKSLELQYLYPELGPDHFLNSVHVRLPVDGVTFYLIKDETCAWNN